MEDCWRKDYGAVSLPKNSFTECPECGAKRLIVIVDDVHCPSCKWDSVRSHGEALATIGKWLPITNEVNWALNSFIKRLNEKKQFEKWQFNNPDLSPAINQRSYKATKSKSIDLTKRKEWYEKQNWGTQRRR